jgi:hypothetical protein
LALLETAPHEKTEQGFTDREIDVSDIEESPGREESDGSKFKNGDRITHAYGYMLESEDGRYGFTNTLPEFVIEPDSDRTPESSISPPDIEPESDRPPESSISGFNEYPKIKNGKTYRYWRYSYREAGKMRHIQIGSFDRVKELQGKSREEISQALGKTRKTD